MFKIKEGDIMATRSFTDTYMVDKKISKKFMISSQNHKVFMQKKLLVIKM